MATRVYCDRCDYDVTDVVRRRDARVVLKHPPATAGGFDRSLDLCVDCARELSRWVNGKPSRVEAA